MNIFYISTKIDLIMSDEYEITACGTRLTKELRNWATEEVANETYQFLIKIIPEKITGMTEEAANFIINSGSGGVTLHDLLNVMPKVNYGDKWLSGDVINLYLDMLVKKYGSILYVDSLEGTAISNGVANSKSLTEVLHTSNEYGEINSCRHMWPVLAEGNHWILIVVDFVTKIITIYDSRNFGEKYRKQAENIYRFYQKTNRFPQRILVVDEAREPNAGVNCGVYVLLQACILSFQLRHLSYEEMRIRLACELATGELMEYEPTDEQVDQLGNKLIEYDQVIAKAALKEKTAELEKKRALSAEKPKPKLSGLEFISLNQSAMDVKARWPQKEIQVFVRKVERVLPLLRTLCRGEIEPEEEMSVCVSPEVVMSSEDNTPAKRLKSDETATQDSVEVIDEPLGMEKKSSSRIPSRVRNYFMAAVKSVPTRWRNTVAFRRKLAKEMKRMAEGKRPSTAPALPVDMNVRRRKIFNDMKREPYMLFGEKEQFSWPRMKDLKADISRATYEDGLSGDERVEETTGPPFDKRYKVQCRICGHLSASEKDFQAHIQAYAHDEIFQRPQKDTYQFHPRIDTVNLPVPRQWSALYGQQSRIPRDMTAEEMSDMMTASYPDEKGAEQGNTSEFDDDQLFNEMEESMLEDTPFEVTRVALREEEETEEELNQATTSYAYYLLEVSKTKEKEEEESFEKEEEESVGLSQESIADTSAPVEKVKKMIEVESPLPTDSAEKESRKTEILRSAYPLRSKTRNTE